jgi:hypothetical protein
MPSTLLLDSPRILSEKAGELLTAEVTPIGHKLPGTRFPLRLPGVEDLRNLASYGPWGGEPHRSTAEAKVTAWRAPGATAWKGRPDGTRIVHPVLVVVDVSTGTSSKVVDGGHAEWLEDDTRPVSHG